MERENNSKTENKFAKLTPVLPILLTGCQKFPNAEQELAATGLFVAIGTIVYLGYRSHIQHEKNCYNRELKDEINRRTKNRSERHWLYKDNKKR